jgi:hypothetical protein
MADSFIPTRDADALAWMQVFAEGLTASPGTYMVSAADAATVTAAVNGFAAAYAATVDPATRTKITVSAKDSTRISAEQVCRQFAALIKQNSGISNEDKLAIGVRPVNSSRSPINVPNSSPLLNIIGATPGAQTVRYSRGAALA